MQTHTHSSFDLLVHGGCWERSQPCYHQVGLHTRTRKHSPPTAHASHCTPPTAHPSVISGWAAPRREAGQGRPGAAAPPARLRHPGHDSIKECTYTHTPTVQEGYRTCIGHLFTLTASHTWNTEAYHALHCHTSQRFEMILDAPGASSCLCVSSQSAFLATHHRG